MGSRSSAAAVRASLYSVSFASLAGGVTLGGIAAAPLVTLDGCFIYRVQVNAEAINDCIYQNGDIKDTWTLCTYNISQFEATSQ